LNTLRVDPENIKEIRDALGLVKTSMKKLRI
jgi:hypothetical protein